MKPTTTDDLIAAQLREFPDSRIVTHDQAAWWPQEPISEAIVPRAEGGTADYVSAMWIRAKLRCRQYEWLDMCFGRVRAKHQVIFFERDWNPLQHRYMKRGCRWGIQDGEGLSGYPITISDMYRREI